MNRLRSLLHREQGAIVVPALAIAPLLAAACWYQIQVWQNIVQRQDIQNGADAIAAGGAAWLAAGMNVLALVNVVMGFVLMVFVAIRTMQILCVTLAIVIGFFFPGAIAPLGRAADAAYRLEQRVAPHIMRALKVGTESERVVALSFPYVSTVLSPTFGPASSAGRRLGFGVAANFSLVPRRVDVTIGGPFPARMGRLPEELTNLRLPGRAGTAVRGFENLGASLPVEEEDYFAVCARASADWTTLPGVREIPYVDHVGRALSFLGGNLSAVLCTPISDTMDALQDRLEDEVHDAVDARADQEAETICQQKEQDQGWADQNLPAGQLARQRRNCRRGEAGRWKGSDDGRDFERQTRSDGQARLNQLQDTSASVQDIKTAKIWNLISGGAVEFNGNMDDLENHVFLDAWSFFVVPPERTGAGELRSPFLALLTNNCLGCTAPLSIFEADVSSARARMFFRCNARDWLPRDNDQANIHSCADNSMWRPGGWTWTLGVDMSPGEELRDSARQMLAGYFGNFMGGAAQGAIRRVVQLGANGVTGRATDGVIGTWVRRLGNTTAAPHTGDTPGGWFSSWQVDNASGGWALDQLRAAGAPAPGAYVR